MRVWSSGGGGWGLGAREGWVGTGGEEEFEDCFAMVVD